MIVVYRVECSGRQHYCGRLLPVEILSLIDTDQQLRRDVIGYHLSDSDVCGLFGVELVKAYCSN